MRYISLSNKLLKTSDPSNRSKCGRGTSLDYPEVETNLLYQKEEEEMETDTRSSLGQSASETEEDTMSVSKKEVWGELDREGMLERGFGQ